jgi:Fe-S-cluster containining protein
MYMFGIMEAMMSGNRYQAWLDSLEGSRAEDVGETSCQRCGHCCAARPCNPTPDELRTIAEHLNISLKECVKQYFVLDRLGGNRNPFLFPAKVTQKDLVGGPVPAERSYDEGYCIFFNESTKSCRI